MDFAPEYFNGEIRDGFYVQPLMKRAWAAQLEVLEEIDQICMRHNIKYVAIFGTLLGAVRHKGFIPWDDDLDIAMLREDYIRFSHYAKAELPEDWRLYDCDNYDTLLTRINNGFGSRLDQEFLNRFHGCPFAVGVDIFPLDYLPDNKEEEKALIQIATALDLVGRNWESYTLAPEAADSLLHDLEELTGQHVDRTKSIPRQLLHLSDKTASMYLDAKTETVTVVTALERCRNHRIPISAFNHITRLPFENTTIPVMENCESVLKSCYGINYMSPRLGGSTHNYPFFLQPLKQIEAYLDERNIAMPDAFHIYARKDGKPLVSVIVPCRNAEEHIEQCFKSLMCQTVAVTSLEIICVNSASTDNTLNKLKEWERKLGNIVIIVQCEEVFSPEDTQNIGKEYASADQIICLDPSAHIEADYIEKIL